MVKDDVELYHNTRYVIRLRIFADDNPFVFWWQNLRICCVIFLPFSSRDFRRLFGIMMFQANRLMSALQAEIVWLASVF